MRETGLSAFLWWVSAQLLAVEILLTPVECRSLQF
jgi:hypothetical protein